MGVSHSVKELSDKTRRFERNVEQLGTRKSLAPVASAVESVMLRSASSAGIHPGSKIAGRPWRGVYVRTEGQQLAVGYANPAHLVNSRTKPHVVSARKVATKRGARRRQAANLISLLGGGSITVKVRASKGKGAKALHWGTSFAAWVRSPGTRGKRFYEKAGPQAKADGAVALQKQMASVIADVFR